MVHKLKFLFLSYTFFLDYVNDICEVLFTLPLEDMESIIAKYCKNVPEPLNRQFPDRLPKEEAIKVHKTRKSNITTLYPPGEVSNMTIVYIVHLT